MFSDPGESTGSPRKNQQKAFYLNSGTSPAFQPPGENADTEFQQAMCNSGPGVVSTERNIKLNKECLRQ